MGCSFVLNVSNTKHNVILLAVEKTTGIKYEQKVQ